MRAIATLAVLACMPAVGWAQTPSGGREFSLTPQAYVQLDFRSFHDWTVTPGTGRLERDTIELRRIRAGLDGRWRAWSFEFRVDPMDEDENGTIVKDAYGQLAFGNYRLRVGQFKPPGSREYTTAARSTDFLERTALAMSLAPHRDLGVSLHGDIGRHVDYEGGVFAGDDNGANHRAGLTVAGRLEWEPSNALILGAYASGGTLSAVEADPENGLEGRMPSGYRFFEDVYVDGRRWRLGGDVEWSPGDWQFTLEALRVREERHDQGIDHDDLPAVVGTGASITARWQFGRRRDAAVRYEYLGFDDAGPDVGTSSVRPRAANIRARAAHAVTVGASWRLSSWLKLLGNAGFERYTEPRSAPNPGDERFFPVLSARFQFELP